MNRADRQPQPILPKNHVRWHTLPVSEVLTRLDTPDARKGLTREHAASLLTVVGPNELATDDGVVLATYLGQEFERRPAQGIADIRAAVIAAGTRRVRPCLMTSATTVLSLMPVLTSDGRGADVMIPIALPSVGGLTIELLSLFILPVCYSLLKEMQWRFGRRRDHFGDVRTASQA